MWANVGHPYPPSVEDKILQRTFTDDEEKIFKKALKKVCPKYFQESPYDICWSNVFAIAKSYGLQIEFNDNDSDFDD